MRKSYNPWTHLFPNEVIESIDGIAATDIDPFINESNRGLHLSQSERIE